MIRVDIMLVPQGNERRTRHLARLEIANLSDLAAVSDYRWRYATIEGEKAEGVVRGHRRADRVLVLLRRVFNALNAVEALDRETP